MTTRVSRGKYEATLGLAAEIATVTPLDRARSKPARRPVGAAA